MSTTETTQPASTAKLAVFWLYVLIPLAWGVVNTLLQAMKLFGR
ncbi:oxalate:formate antiporter [Paraburkholderia sp. BCC1885]|nr:oxalate:formate antiporter [Paraburkholderia sp. BCC1885]